MFLIGSQERRQVIPLFIIFSFSYGKRKKNEYTYQLQCRCNVYCLVYDGVKMSIFTVMQLKILKDTERTASEQRVYKSL